MKLSVRLFLCAALCAAATSYAADRTNFAGSYTLTPRKESRKSEKETVKTLTVIQTESAIDVTEVEGERTKTYRYPLTGQDGTYVSPTGIRGTCKGKLRKNDLILESFVTTRPDPNGPPIQIHTKQKWELSPDLKTLRIHVEVDSPQSPINLVDPWTDVYTRN
jgi:hypothetical protein